MRPNPPSRCELVVRQRTRRVVTLSDPDHPLHEPLSELRERVAAWVREHPGSDLRLDAGEQRTLLRVLDELSLWDAAVERASELECKIARAEEAYRSRHEKPANVLDALLGRPFSRLGPGLLPWEHRGRRRGTVNKHALVRDYLRVLYGTGTVELYDPLAAGTGDVYQALAVSDCPREPIESVKIVAYWHELSEAAALKSLYAVKRAAKQREAGVAARLELPGKADLPGKAIKASRAGKYSAE